MATGMNASRRAGCGLPGPLCVPPQTSFLVQGTPEQDRRAPDLVLIDGKRPGRARPVCQLGTFGLVEYVSLASGLVLGLQSPQAKIL